MISFSLKLVEIPVHLLFAIKLPNTTFPQGQSSRLRITNPPTDRHIKTNPGPKTKSHKHKTTDRSPNSLPCHGIALYRAHPSHTSGQTPQADKSKRATSARDSPAHARPADREIISHRKHTLTQPTRSLSIDRPIFAASLTRAHNTLLTRLFGTIRARQPTGVRMTGCVRVCCDGRLAACMNSATAKGRQAGR